MVSAKSKSKPKVTTRPNTQKARRAKTKPTATSPRRLKPYKYKSFRLHRPIKPTQPKILGSFRLMIQTIRYLKQRIKVYTGLVIVFLLLNLVFVKGFSNTLDLVSIKTTLTGLFTGASGNAASSLALFGLLIGSNGTVKTSNGANVYQLFFIVTFILALVWTFRNSDNPRLRVRDGYYLGMQQLVQFTMVMLVVALELLPLGIAAWLFSVMIQSGLAITALEQFISILLVISLALISMYMLTSSIFALMVVTIPGVSPMRALRSARELVRYRRLVLLRKLLFLPLAFLISGALLMFPFLVFLPVIAEWVFFVITGFAWLVGIRYVFGLYEELLND